MFDILERLKAALADRYAIEREIGAGGMATVYLAEDLKHHRKVAVKVLQPDLAVAIGAVRFLREIEIAATLTHPHILPLHDSGEADGFLFYVMPYIEGETLRGRIRRERQLGLEDALQITREVADGLSYAHGRGVVHRDIKPENILLASGHAVVADFGIARAITQAGRERLTETGLSVGTPAYMSPEQAMGEQDVDARSDIYSLGCVAYEMLAGDPPFAGTNPQAILARKTLESPPPLRTARDTVPEVVEQAILKALAKVPADRFATAQLFRDALAFTPASGTVVVPAPQKRMGPRALGLVALLAVLIAFGGWWFPRFFTHDEIESLVVLPFYNATGDPEQEYFHTGMHQALIGALSQIGGLQVRSLTSALRYKDSEKSIPEIARELNVDAVVEASVLRSGGSLNLEVQLIDALPEERELWSQSFDRSMDDVLVLYNDVAQAIAREAQVELTPDEQARLGTARQIHQEVFDAYLRGMFFVNKDNPEDAERGLVFLREAVDIDPADPLAYAGLAIGYDALLHGPTSRVEALPLAESAAEIALRLDPTQAEARGALAYQRAYHHYEWDEAEQMFLRALELKPSLPTAHYYYSWQLALFERMDEAWEEHKLAEELDPMNPRQAAGLGWLHLMDEQWDEAEVEARKSLLLDPRFPAALMVLAEAHAARGDLDEAVAVGQLAHPMHRGWILGRQLALAGRTQEAREIAAELEADEPNVWVAWNLAVLYATLGEKDDAFRWLNYEPSHPWTSWSRVFVQFESLWDDPRFADFMEKRNLPWPTEAYSRSRMQDD